MKEFENNPRRITDSDLHVLESNIVELGDLSGIIHDRDTDEIIGGNQRSKVININKCKIEIVKQFEEPDGQGTIALGYVIYKGQKLNYRQVVWNAKQIEKANITANKLGGEFDLVMLQHFNEKDLLQWGFKDYELFDFGIIDKAGESGLLRKSIRDISEDFSLTLHFNKKDQHLVEAFCKETGKKKMTEFIINHLKTQPNA
jgi:hypothetical protein